MCANDDAIEGECVDRVRSPNQGVWMCVIRLCKVASCVGSSLNVHSVSWASPEALNALHCARLARIARNHLGEA